MKYLPRYINASKEKTMLLTNGDTRTIYSKTAKFGPFPKALGLAQSAVYGPYVDKEAALKRAKVKAVVFCVVCLSAALVVGFDLFVWRR